MVKFTCIVAAAVLLCSALVYCAPAEQEITYLPGAPEGWNSTFQMYSGYMSINSNTNSSYFYWFVTSQRDPVTDPLLLWMNGGPGASSLMGFFTEHGPFRPNPDGETLAMYPYAWNRIANVLYVEAPVGVGFSYSDVSLEYITNDNKTAAQNYEFLLNWFEAFPEYQANDFWITGESYAGKYCPQLAAQVLDGIEAGNTPWLNMKGIMVGNPGTESDWYGAPDEYAFLTTLYNHFIIPQANYTAAHAACNWGDFLSNCDTVYTDPTSDCRKATIAALTYLPDVIDPYDLYAPVCLSDNPEAAKRWDSTLRKRHPVLNLASSGVTFYPCIDDFMSAYLNQPDVQEAIHVMPTNWKYEGGIVYLNEYVQSVIPLWQRFITDTDWNLVVFSGDVDAAVPTVGTERWINCLDLPIVNGWRPWMYDGQTAGFVQDFSRMTFITIKGAGHMVPYYLPAQGYEFFAQYMSRFY